MPLLPRRWPLIPTLLVTLAAGLMVALGVWQLQRHTQKQQAIALIRANYDKGAITFPQMGPVPTDTLFRRSALNCLRVIGWSTEAGKAADGTSGFRLIAQCSTGAEGPGALVEVGIATRPESKSSWQGGPIRGRIVEEPDHRSLLSHLTGPQIVLRPMLIAETSPDPALRTPAPPSIEAIPDNHFGYAIQWFLFAGVAVLIYILALARQQAGPKSDS